MTRTALCLALAALALPVAAAGPQSDEDKTLYVVGVAVAEQLSSLSLTPAEAQWVAQGLADALAGAPLAADLETYAPKMQALVEAREAAAGEKSAAAGRAFAEQAAKEPGAVKTPTGLVYRATLEGSGATPKVTDTVKVIYRGTLMDGAEFDSSERQGGPVEFQLDQVVPCWTEGVHKMKAGGKARLVCPPEIAYGERGAGGVIPPNATLIFEIELLEVGGAN
jgi:FKBP-type peptidyl-prolyl cis-trans isomerase FkpA